MMQKYQFFLKWIYAKTLIIFFDVFWRLTPQNLLTIRTGLPEIIKTEEIIQNAHSVMQVKIDFNSNCNSFARLNFNVVKYTFMIYLFIYLHYIEGGHFPDKEIVIFRFIRRNLNHAISSWEKIYRFSIMYVQPSKLPGTLTCN